LPLGGAETDRPSAGRPEPFLATPFSEGAPSISPDGRWLAYQSNETGDSEIFVTRFPEGGGKWRVSNGGGKDPAWSKKSGGLFYMGSRGIMVVRYRVDHGSFVPDKERVWAERADARVFAIAPDESRAIVIESEPAKFPDGQIVFVQGFLDELRRGGFMKR
jgi:hypothetical protein